MATKVKGKDGEGDKVKKSKKESSSKKKEKTKEPKPTPAPTLVEPEPSDPDAIQLFRRYDREKLGHITRFDFMELLKDYTDSYPHRKSEMAISPCALTDAAGIPLGFERTAKNSEFEAGQLFERYDTNRSGTLDLKEFHGFFRDFKKQLTPFVEELQSPKAFKHYVPPASFVAKEPLSWMYEDQRYPSIHQQSAQQHFQSKLTLLNDICDEVLLPYRVNLQEKVEHLPKSTTKMDKLCDGCTSTRTGIEQLEIQNDIDSIDRLTSRVKTTLFKGPHLTSNELHQFLDDFPKLHATAEELAHKAKTKKYGDFRPQVNEETEKLLKIKDQ
ncbi:hypothetical protein THRCLA_05939, partial [Thraustotheca clavata]